MSTVGKINFPTREVGQTGVRITTLGLGGATLGGMMAEVPPDQARATVARALETGIGYFDTAPQYGFGRSEHFMGDALRFHREGTVLSTKVGRLLRPVQSDSERVYPHTWVNPFPFDMVYDYSYDAVKRSLEDSLQRLGLPSVDIVYVHDIGVMTHGEKNAGYWEQLKTGGYRALLDLKKAGTIKAIGLGVNEWQVLMDAFELGDWDVFLLAGRYTLLEQTSLSPFLETCLRRKASVVTGGPFNGGALMGTGTWNYARAPQEIIDRVKQLENFCNDHHVSIGAAALQFPLAHPAIANVLPGPKSPAELDGILEWWQTEIPASFWDALADAKLVAPGTPLPNGRTA
ncbi:MAG TPA: aldo/keto reductase [Devosiaceae bacterium]|nr:aldo/keto reductase [Devosiaceae bacterium]